MTIPRRLSDLYRFPGFEPDDHILVDEGEPGGVLITLHRRPQKDTVVFADSSHVNTTTHAGDTYVTSPVVIVPSRFTFLSIALSAIGAAV
jgi:hypothetical protein